MNRSVRIVASASVQAVVPGLRARFASVGIALISVLVPLRAEVESASAPVRPTRGFRYQHEVVAEMPWSIHVVRIQRGHPELRLETTLGRSNTLGMGLVSEQARATPSKAELPIAAINGDFYTNEDDYPGRPRDLQIRRGELLTDPDGHTCFWIDPSGSPRMTNVLSRFRVLWPDGSETPIGLNEPRSSSKAVLYTAAIGASTRTQGGIDFVLGPTADAASPETVLRPGRRYSLALQRLVPRGNASLTPSNLVLSLGSRLTAKYRHLLPGSTLTVITETVPDLAGVETAIGGGPALVVDGQAMRWSGLNLRHPRTAIGWNDETIFLVEVDGRQGDLSIGMSFPELAEYLQKLGCRQAMNLDGGGSATMWVLGNVINSPSEGRERPAANALVLTERRAPAQPSPQESTRTAPPPDPGVPPAAHPADASSPQPGDARLPSQANRPPIAAPPPDANPTRSPAPGDALFAEGSFVEIDLTLHPSALERLRAAPRGFVPATFAATLLRSSDSHPATTVRLPASVRLKGSIGSFRPVDDKPSWTVDFGSPSDASRWDGLRRVYLNNALEDPSLLHEALGSEIFLAQGIPAPRVTHARVRLSGRPLGLYVLKEAFTEAFLVRHFGRGDGELYDNDEGPDLDQPLHRNLPTPAAEGQPSEGLRIRLSALAEAVGDPDPASRWSRLSDHLDADRFLTFAALEVLIGHRDGYGLARNNFRLYRDPGSDRWMFLPDGMDQLFGLANFPWRPQMSGLAARALLESEQGRRDYTRRFLQLLDTVFRPPSPVTRVERLASALRPRLDSGERRAFDHEVTALCRRIDDRERELRIQVAAEVGGNVP